MTIQPVIITCPGREAMLEQTLASLKQTDFDTAGVSPLVQMDNNHHERRQERQEHNSLSALMLAERTGAELVMFLEDDIVFNRHLLHNLSHWKPLQYPWFTFASLYNPTIRQLNVCPAKHYMEADPNCVYGSQAYVLSRRAVQFCIKNWWEVMGMQDIKISRLCASMGSPLYYHMPSLVQHVGKVSTFGGGFHYAPDFNENFKAV